MPADFPVRSTLLRLRGAVGLALAVAVGAWPGWAADPKPCTVVTETRGPLPEGANVIVAPVPEGGEVKFDAERCGNDVSAALKEGPVGTAVIGQAGKLNFSATSPAFGTGKLYVIVYDEPNSKAVYGAICQPEDRPWQLKGIDGGARDLIKLFEKAKAAKAPAALTHRPTPPPVAESSVAAALRLAAGPSTPSPSPSATAHYALPAAPSAVPSALRAVVRPGDLYANGVSGDSFVPRLLGFVGVFGTICGLGSYTWYLWRENQQLRRKNRKLEEDIAYVRKLRDAEARRADNAVGESVQSAAGTVGVARPHPLTPQGEGRPTNLLVTPPRSLRDDSPLPSMREGVGTDGGSPEAGRQEWAPIIQSPPLSAEQRLARAFLDWCRQESNFFVSDPAHFGIFLAEALPGCRVTRLFRDRNLGAESRSLFADSSEAKDPIEFWNIWVADGESSWVVPRPQFSDFGGLSPIFDGDAHISPKAVTSFVPGKLRALDQAGQYEIKSTGRVA